VNRTPSTNWRPDRQPDVICAAVKCDADVETEAPVPLCGVHLRVAFAYVLENAEQHCGGLTEQPLVRYPQVKTPGATLDKPGWVYFIEKNELIKIGWSAEPRKRFSVLQPNRVLHLMRGTVRDERKCHAAFAHLREQGEWFRIEPDLLAFISSLKSTAA
jgi:hypothetical protein